MSVVLSIPPAPPEQAAAHFAARLTFQTDVADVHADLVAGVPSLVVVDSRSRESWDQGHLPGAVHLPTARITADAPALVSPDAVVVTYCWGPGCDGAARAALAFARLGYRVKEMLGGYEYWVRAGYRVHGAAGPVIGLVDPLTTLVRTADSTWESTSDGAPDSASACGC